MIKYIIVKNTFFDLKGDIEIWIKEDGEDFGLIINDSRFGIFKKLGCRKVTKSESLEELRRFKVEIKNFIMNKDNVLDLEEVLAKMDRLIVKYSS